MCTCLHLAMWSDHVDLNVIMLTKHVMIEASHFSVAIHLSLIASVGHITLTSYIVNYYIALQGL